MPPILFAEPEVSRRGVTEAELEDIEARARLWLAPAIGPGLAADVVVLEGSQPAAEIVTRAASLPAGLIVLGTHGRSGFDHLLLGSVTEKVLRKAPCPVMTVPPRVASASRLPYTRLLCPVDFSNSSLTALRFALSIAKESDAALTIVFVLEWRAEGVPSVEFRREAKEDAQRQLDALLSDEDRMWCRPTTQILHGRAYEEILTLARDDGTDLIVIGVHGRKVIDRMLFGSTTNHVVRQATCPVLTIRE